MCGERERRMEDGRGLDVGGTQDWKMKNLVEIPEGCAQTLSQ